MCVVLVSRATLAGAIGVEVLSEIVAADVVEVVAGVVDLPRPALAAYFIEKSGAAILRYPSIPRRSARVLHERCRLSTLRVKPSILA